MIFLILFCVIKLLLYKNNYKIINFILMHEVMNTGPFTSPFKRSKVALGNNQPRYNSQVEGIRQKFFINSTRNSQDTPEWMSRTNSHYHRANMKNRNIYSTNDPNFMAVRQKNIYEKVPKIENTGGQFEVVSRKKIRSQWQMKNHTFELEWPKPQEKRERTTTQRFFLNFDKQNTNFTRDFAYNMPKYAIKQSPLHVQKETPIKIGHKSTVDSIKIK